jgi:hypothetical protein
MILYPDLAKVMAQALPIHEVAPVTKAILFFMLKDKKNMIESKKNEKDRKEGHLTIKKIFSQLFN